ncbi:MAG TPA: hypothetical protein PKW18_00025 [Candidatus Sumerlaeota bacterium]|nr:hypothetical protein [Candidatus Sumerlaeota bacterium]HRR30008.1 hypothetical protein [Candidatus Sumerlaeia bacterium]HON49462.1 hypothetical protein [Candidatus Sumerlaeota bacterium]HOR64788.1 hypothetical protein [Candidatus Sumerlaeota bacterium]HPL72941.1 hypothetical protein [Candidatus Sumerlaeota bacterium]
MQAEKWLNWLEPPAMRCMKIHPLRWARREIILHASFGGRQGRQTKIGYRLAF